MPIKEISAYNNEITFKVVSEYCNYRFYYALNGVDFTLFETTKANYILSKKYTGAYLGIYTTSNGEKTKDYADYDWVNYKAYERY